MNQKLFFASPEGSLIDWKIFISGRTVPPKKTGALRAPDCFNPLCFADFWACKDLKPSFQKTEAEVKVFSFESSQPKKVQKTFIGNSSKGLLTGNACLFKGHASLIKENASLFKSNRSHFKGTARPFKGNTGLSKGNSSPC